MKLLKFLIKLIITGALLYFLFRNIDFVLFLEKISHANLVLVVISAMIAFPGIYISILKWDLFLKNFGISLKRLKLFSLYCISSYFNNFLPSTIGGDAYRFIYLKDRYPQQKKHIASAIILERFTGLFSLFFINFLLVPFYFDEIINNRVLSILELVTLFIFIGILFAIFIFRKIRITNHRFLSFSFTNKILSLIKSLYDLKDRKVIYNTLAYSFIFSLLVASARLILFRAFNLEVPFLYILFVSTIIQVVGIFPISLNSIGVTEGLSVFLYSIIGIPADLSLAIALVARVSLLVTSCMGGIFYFLNGKIDD